MLNPDYRDMLLLLNEEGVEYLIVGAYALATYGFPRATGDIDLWIKPSPENAEKVWKAIIKFGAPLVNLTKEDLSTPEIIFQIGIVPRRIDIITSIDGVTFEQAWPERKQIEIEGLTVLVIGRHHLLINKQSTGRKKDLADVLWLTDSDS